MDEKIIIIQLTTIDANRILALVQREIAWDNIWSDYWQEIANQMQQDIQAQKSGQFFQCAACNDL